ncbi:MAG: hypothetical protein KGH63_01150 [Candidatus Micrarchaeota archaeon]|nr:hypothetical protein [Candidatus Micrarchaeota archaeon]
MRWKQKSKALRGQAVMDYVIIASVGLTIALVVLGLASSLPDFGQSIQNKLQGDYWHAQARPFVVPDAFYRESSSRFYLALEVEEPEAFNLTGVFINGTQVAFYTYNPAATDGVGVLQCTSGTCQSTPCTCDYPMRSSSSTRIVTETYFNVFSTCGATGAQSPLDVKFVYFRPSDPTRNLTEIGVVPLPFSCQ